MLTKNINFKNFKLKKSNNDIKKDLEIILRKNNEIIKSLRKADSYSGPLLIWIISKITTLAFLASKEEKPQLFLKSNGVWQSKINDYMSFIKKQSDNDLDIMQRNIYDLELALKGMIKKDFWLELESMICRLDVN